MRRCIICKEYKEESEFNLEHVFPESIGGEYTINTVCSDCNSHFGRTVDNKFLNSGVIRFLNHNFKIKNKNGKVVPSVPETIVDPYDSSIKLKTFYDNHGELKDTEFETTFNNNTFRFDESRNINTALSELDILLKKNKIPLPLEIDTPEKKKEYMLKLKEQIQEKYYSGEFKESKDPIDVTLETNAEEIILESIKISYELSHKILGEKYFEDKLCDVFREYLIAGKLDDNLSKKINFISEVKDIEKFSKLHVFCLIRFENFLFSFVLLYGTFASIFIISENGNQYNLENEVSVITNKE